jgi:hypothetical protein
MAREASDILYVNAALRLLGELMTASHRPTDQVEPMNAHQQARLLRQAKARFSFAGARRSLSIGLLIVFIVSVMTAWFGFLGWGLIEALRPLVDFVRHLWSMV